MSMTSNNEPNIACAANPPSATNMADTTLKLINDCKDCAKDSMNKLRGCQESDTKSIQKVDGVLGMLALNNTDLRELFEILVQINRLL